MYLSKKGVKAYMTLSGVNRVIKIMILSDIFILGSAGMVAPIFAIFVTDNIAGGSIQVAGIAAAIFLLVRSLGQIFAAEIIDKIKGEKDDFWAMFYGSIIMSLIYLGYIFVSTPLELYIVQFFLGLATAFTFPSWSAIYTRHIDKNYEGREWGFYYTLTDLSAAGAASIGGIIAYSMGFTPVFIIVSIIGLIGAALLLIVKDSMIVNKK